MTKAVCYECGEIKFGALNACERCGAEPYFEDDVVKSLLLSDHYLKDEVMDEIALRIKNGHELLIDENSLANHKKQLRKSGVPLVAKAKDAGLLGKIFRTNQAPKNIQDAKWYIVADILRDINLTLSDKKSIYSVSIYEGAFCQLLMMAKQAGWKGGRRFFQYKKEGNLAYPLPINNGVGIYDNEAIDFSEFLIAGAKQQGLYKESNETLDIIKKMCELGGFRLTY